MSSESARQPDSAAPHKDARDLVQGALVNYIGMFAKLGKVLFIFVAARIYGPAALGLYLLAWSAVDLASKFGLWGLDRSLIRDIARYNVDDSAETKARIFGTLRFNIGLAAGLSLVATAAAYSLSALIAIRIFKDPALVAPIRILVFALPFVVMSQVFIASTKALRIMRYDVLIRQGFEPLILFICAVAFIPIQRDAVGLATAHVIASFIASIAAAFAMLRTFRHLGWSHKPLPAEIKRDILRYTSPMAAMDFLNLMVARMDILMVGYFLNTAMAGLYGIAIEIISVIKRVRQGFEPIFSPIVSELFYQKQDERLNRTYVLLSRWLLAGTLLPVLAMVLFPAQFLGLFSAEAVKAAGALSVLAVAHGLLGAFSASENLIVMTGKSLLNTALAAAMLLVNTVVGVLLIPRIGLMGAAVGTLAAFAAVSAMRVIYCSRALRLHPFKVPLLWPLVVGVVNLLLFYGIKSAIEINSILELAAALLALIVTYVGLYFWGAKEPEESYFIEKLLGKLRRGSAAKSA